MIGFLVNFGNSIFEIKAIKQSSKSVGHSSVGHIKPTNLIHFDVYLVNHQ